MWSDAISRQTVPKWTYRETFACLEVKTHTSSYRSIQQGIWDSGDTLECFSLTNLH